MKDFFSNVLVWYISIPVFIIAYIIIRKCFPNFNQENPVE